LGKTAEKRKKKKPRVSANVRHKPPEYRLPVSESQEIVLAIRRGKVDALVTSGSDGDQVLMLQHAEQPYRVLVETINDGVATLDATGFILYANSRMAAILRASDEPFIGTLLGEHIPASDREMLRKLIAEGLSNSTQGELTLNATEGRPRLVRLALNPVKNSEPRTVCVVATELTELAEANEALRANEESLRQLSARLLMLQDEERRHIARDLHDVTGQKLAAQSMALSQLINAKSSPLDAESKRILSEVATLSKQVGDEIRTLSYLLHPPLLDELGLSSAVKWYAEGFERRTGIQVKVDIPSDFVRLPPDVEVTLFRIIQESLSNVHRYSGSPGATVQVKLSANQIEVRISDTGKGMHLSSFNSSTGKVAPLGVGIQGMTERVRQLSGKLHITSQPNKGTMVTATIPLASSRPDAAQEGASSVGAPSSSAQEGLTGSADGERRRILIVDDHEMLRHGIRTILQKETDLEICGEAIDGQDAIDKVVALRPDLVILDINLPVLNGLVAARQMLRHRPQTKILVFTVHDSAQTAKEIRSAGAHAYLSKGTGSDDLLRVVRSLLDNTIPAIAAPAVVMA
jgi:PAS domain S-box-containing protein